MKQSELLNPVSSGILQKVIRAKQVNPYETIILYVFQIICL